MSRPARALLDANALRHNLERVRYYAPQSKILAIVKANAYGHGIVWAARALRKADAFGVASIEEGIELRTSGVTQPICLLEGFFEASEIALLIQHKLDTVVHHEAQVAALEQMPASAAATLDVWLKIDTGMHRLGFAPAIAPTMHARLTACKGVRRVRFMTHFANADNTFDSTTPAQIERFTAAISAGETGAGSGERSLANSAGIVAWPASRLEWVRPGIMLYGVSPLIGRSAAELGLKPVMSLASAVIAVHRLRKGDAVGYGGDWICPEDMPVAVVAIGYGDGYPRQLAAGTPVLLNGRRVSLIGRVSMDMITLDLRAQPDARVGDPVVLWGAGLPVEEIAARAGTIGYSLLCGVTPRIPRVEASAHA